MSTLHTREALIEATAEVIRRFGVARLTTREVARVAGRSEGSIYNHFADKLDLVEAVLRTYVERLRASFDRLEPGEGDLAERLRTLMAEQIAARRQLLPIEAGLIADPEMRERHREMLDDAQRGPQRAHHKLTTYLQAEQQLGRFPADRDPATTAFMVIGACREGTFLELTIGSGQLPMPLDELPSRVVAELLG